MRRGGYFLAAHEEPATDVADLGRGREPHRALLAAIAARELVARRAELASALEQGRAADEVLRMTLRGYVDWARERPARFKLTFGTWTADGKGHADPEDLVDDLLGYLRAAVGS